MILSLSVNGKWHISVKLLIVAAMMTEAAEENEEELQIDYSKTPRPEKFTVSSDPLHLSVIIPFDLFGAGGNAELFLSHGQIIQRL